MGTVGSGIRRFPRKQQGVLVIVCCRYYFCVRKKKKKKRKNRSGGGLNSDAAFISDLKEYRDDGPHRRGKKKEIYNLNEMSWHVRMRRVCLSSCFCNFGVSMLCIKYIVWNLL